MAMNVGSGAEGEVMVEMNTTPLIDVMLVLLTLLIITIPIQTHAVKLDMPRPNATPPTNPPDQIQIHVDFDNSVTWNDAPVDRATMESYLKDAAAKTPQPELHVQVDPIAKYDVVARVLADAQRIGVTHIGFVGLDQYN
jgi:biopolymer transport protein ExbD